MSNYFEDQRAVIVGGSAGLGLATAQLLAAEGAAVAIVGGRHVDDALERLPAGAEGYACDVRDEAALATLFAEIGAFDHLAYTAGEALSLSPLAELDLTSARERLEIRLWGALATLKHAVPQIRPGGSIVLTSGSAGARPQPAWALGAMTCGAVEALTRTLALELAPIRVNAVAPGVVRTDLWRELTAEQRDGMYADLAATLPVGRPGEPEDVAAAYVHLMANGYTTGSVLPIDGGALLV
jgi:NAD(P)-dependent dehydrogenase (short-subunit alcohol dehydrogenase family)